MNIEEKNRIQKINELIRRAILVSQMQDHKGFEVFMEDTEEIVKGFQFQDVRGLKDLETLHKAQGYVQAIEDLKYYFSSQRNFALKPMTDEVTGEEEKLNEK